MKKNNSHENTIGWRQNNYGNLRGDNVNWNGKTGMENGFSVFVDPQHGVRAIFVDLNSKIRRGLDTIDQIIPVYAPSGDGNNPEKYIEFLEKNYKTPRHMKLTINDLPDVVRGIIKMEIGYNAPDELINKAYQMAFTEVPKKTEAQENREAKAGLGGNITSVTLVVIVIAVVYYFFFK